MSAAETAPIAKPLLRPRELQEIEHEIRTGEAQLADNSIEGRISDKKTVKKRIARLRKAVEENGVKPVPEKHRDEMVKNVGILEGSIRDGMPSRDEMMRNPPGAVGKNIKWQRAKKPLVQAWKRAMAQLEYGSDDPDVCNVERLRPEWGAAELPMQGAQIGRKAIFSAPSAQFTQNFDAIDWKQKHDALEARLADLEKAVTQPDAKPATAASHS